MECASARPIESVNRRRPKKTIIRSSISPARISTSLLGRHVHRRRGGRRPASTRDQAQAVFTGPHHTQRTHSHSAHSHSTQRREASGAGSTSVLEQSVGVRFSVSVRLTHADLVFLRKLRVLSRESRMSETSHTSYHPPKRERRFGEGSCVLARWRQHHHLQPKLGMEGMGKGRENV